MFPGPELLPLTVDFAEYFEASDLAAIVDEDDDLTEAYEVVFDEEDDEIDEE